MGAPELTHGALDYAELSAYGIAPESLLDFSSNINPFGPPSEVRAALAALDPAPYPDRSCLSLRQLLAQRHGCTLAQLLPGNGSNELIHLLARAVLRPGAATLILGPTFGEYAHACRLAEAQVTEITAPLTPPFALDLETILAQIRQLRPRLTWLCAPNNPTGILPTAAAIQLLADACAAVDGLLVLDRAYASFVQDGESIPRLANVLELYSLTKSYALAGLRLGYLLGEAPIIAQVARYQPTWSVNSAAQAAGLAALQARDFLPATLPQLWQASDQLCDGLRRLGVTVWRDRLPFLLAHTSNATATRQTLLRHGLLVRDCGSFGLPDWVRLAPQSLAANVRLLEVWKCLLGK